jgi:murein DD-endopeptidase MepM/ murein hydrolase activator NlpD
MARPLRILAAAACVGVLFGAQALALPGGRPRPESSPSPSQMDRIRERTVSLSVAVARAESRSAEIEQALQPLEAAGRPNDEVLTRQRYRMLERAGLAIDRVERWAPRENADAHAMGEPLRTLAGALHASDEYRSALMEQVGDAETRRDVLARMVDQIRQIRFDLLGRLPAAQSDLATLTQAAHRDAEGAPVFDGSVDEIRGLVGRAQAVDMDLRLLEARVQSLSISMNGSVVTFREGMRTAQHTVKDLEHLLVSTEGTLAGLMAGLFADFTDSVAVNPDGLLQVCPVDPPFAYSDDFGAPRYAGGYHPHAGIDMLAPEGTPIRAVFPGNAVDASNTLGGNAVKVYGALGYTYYAHLSAFGTLGPVEAGEIIGRVGETGDTNVPHLHFEWHPNNGDAVNPFDLLNAACRSGTT